MICRHCGQEYPDPPIVQALTSGFNPGTHCRMLATNQGLVEKCCNWQGYQYCETCPKAKGMFRQKANKTK